MEAHPLFSRSDFRFVYCFLFKFDEKALAYLSSFYCSIRKNIKQGLSLISKMIVLLYSKRLVEVATSSNPLN